MSRIEEIENDLTPLREQLQKHQLYNELKSLDDVRLFMEMHVFAVLGLYVAPQSPTNKFD